MKIAFISYEYPPDTAVGGIATYIYQIAMLLQERGHYIEVFAGSNYRSSTETENNIIVHRVLTKHNSDFSEQIAQIFSQRHHLINFDVVEGPEISACARKSVERFPDIPLVIKLHTPSFLIGQINDVAPSINTKLRWYAGALRHGKIPKPFPRWSYDLHQDIERSHVLEADEITTPSQALGDKLIEVWGLPEDKVVHIPNPYIPSQELLNIAVETRTNIITFIGRLEIRKGILELGAAIPLILKRYPDVRFRFIGSSLPSPKPGLDMQAYLEQKLKRYLPALEFTGSVALDRIPYWLAKTDICVFPSRWENFPNVCLEAMAAARGVVGSSAGGMAEMLDQGKVGRLIPPENSQKIAEAVIELLANPQLRMQLGRAARDRVLSEYNLDRIGQLQEESYERAIRRRCSLGKRIFSN
ncbi:MAG: glycosyltransferase family 4 protein [Mastigocoleus sp.]